MIIEKLYVVFTHFVCPILLHIIIIPTDIIPLYQLEEAKIRKGDKTFSQQCTWEG